MKAPLHLYTAPIHNIIQKHEWLDHGEIKRINEMNDANTRNTFIAARTLLRKALSEQTDFCEQEFIFYSERDQKPFILSPKTAFQFSIAHSKKNIAILIADNIRIGVDVEEARQRLDIVGLAKRFFSAHEYNEILSFDCGVNDNICEAQMNLFLQYWTLREALYKATGAGLTADLSKIQFINLKQNNVDVNDTSIQCTGNIPDGAWKFMSFFIQNRCYAIAADVDNDVTVKIHSLYDH